MRLKLALVLLAAALPLSATNPPGPADRLEKATFAGGCFWSMQHDMEPIPGVVSVISGYTGGTKVNPTYDDVSAGDTGHAEAVEILFDPAKITYRALLDHFWHNVDPTAADRQFCDQGPEYRSEIFYHSEEQRIVAENRSATSNARRNSTSRSSPRSSPPGPSTAPRNTTRITRRKIRSSTTPIERPADATRVCMSCGGKRPSPSESGTGPPPSGRGGARGWRLGSSRRTAGLFGSGPQAFGAGTAVHVADRPPLPRRLPPP